MIWADQAGSPDRVPSRGGGDHGPGRWRTRWPTAQAAVIDRVGGRLGIDATQSFAVHVAREQEQAKQAVKEMDKAIALAGELAVTVEAAETSAAIAHSLAGHLRADGFERWLMAGAVTDLVAGANELLAQLSGGGFSLYADDDGGFAIVDHRNADETRSVSTLSGGETFLVALALAPIPGRDPVGGCRLRPRCHLPR